MDDKTLLFSLSKENKDFIVTPFKGSGKGGQKRNKTSNACRIFHPASGSISECEEERSFEQNKRRAFSRLIEKPKFQAWLELEKCRATGMLASVEKRVEEEMHSNNILVEVKDENNC